MKTTEEMLYSMLKNSSSEDIYRLMLCLIKDVCDMDVDSKIKVDTIRKIVNKAIEEN